MNPNVTGDHLQSRRWGLAQVLHPLSKEPQLCAALVGEGELVVRSRLMTQRAVRVAKRGKAQWRESRPNRAISVMNCCLVPTREHESVKSIDLHNLQAGIKVLSEISILRQAHHAFFSGDGIRRHLYRRVDRSFRWSPVPAKVNLAASCNFECHRSASVSRQAPLSMKRRIEAGEDRNAPLVSRLNWIALSDAQCAHQHREVGLTGRLLHDRSQGVCWGHVDHNGRLERTYSVIRQTTDMVVQRFAVERC